MTTWSIEPRDPLVIGDGRPVSHEAHSRSLDFPWPSTVAGVMRTRALSDRHSGRFTGTPDAARKIAIRGPLLVQLDTPTPQLLVPAPKDALFVRDTSGTVHRQVLAPRDVASGCTSDLEGLRLVRPKQNHNAKAERGAAFWTWSEFEKWLVDPKDHTYATAEAALTAHGIVPLEHETRTHVVIDREKGTASDGQLFRVDGVRFAHKSHRFGLWVDCDHKGMHAGVVGLGGERRPSVLATLDLAAPPCPKAIVDAIAKTRRARIVLLTPAIFGQGFRPDSFGDATLEACAVDRPVHVSGWDWDKRCPKPARRAAPAGSVYWVRIADGVDARRWVEEVWMQNVSSDEQDRRDGFGLAAVGIWEDGR